MSKKKKELASERYEKMDPEERKYEARRRIRRMVAMRILMAGLMVWIMVTNDLSLGVIALLIGVIAMILGSLIPVFKALKTDLKYEDE